MPANRAAIERLFDGMPPWTEKDLESVPIRVVSEREQFFLEALKKIRICGGNLSKRTKKLAEQAICDELNNRFNDGIWR